MEVEFRDLAQMGFELRDFWAQNSHNFAEGAVYGMASYVLSEKFVNKKL